MSYWQESDTFHDDPRWAAAAGDHRAVTVDQLQAGYARLMSVAARHMSSGWLTRETALSLCRPRVLERLSARVLPDMPPWLHTKGDECSCYETWQSGYTYLLHGFLKRNPTKKETERHRAQKRERQDPATRAAVYERDGGCCRYCRSGPLPKKGMGRAKDRRRVIHYDHVHPDKLAGADLANLVVSCGRCNDEKGARTPAEADMILLPVPTEDERVAWLARPECARFDRDDNHNDNAATTPQTTRPALVPTLSDPLSPDDVDGGEVRPETPHERQRQPPGLSPKGVGSGRGPQPALSQPLSSGSDGVDELGQPARAADAPDIYHHRSRPVPPPAARPPPT